jgi:nucleoside-diphosphate-sugar epimerase
METCLVAGGAGFIGSHLVKKLLKDYKVICVDNLSSGEKKNIEDIIGVPNFKFIEHDIRNLLEPEEPIDYIFHLASRASPKDFDKYPIEISITNSLGTYNLLKLAMKKKARFLFASSSEVYGDPLEHPQKEDYYGNVNCNGERACYDESKRFGESITMDFFRKHGIDIRIARIFNTHGPNMRRNDGRVVPNFIIQALSGKPITIYGNGSQTRSFCYVSDMVAGLIKFMFKEDVNQRVLNIGNPNEIKIKKLAEIIKNITKSDSDIAFKPLPKGDPLRRKPNIENAKKELNWEPKISLNEGLKKTIEWFREN